MKKQHITALAAFAAGAMVLAGCAPSGPAADEQAGDEVTLTVWSWQAQMTNDWERVFDIYEESHPGVTVQFEGYAPTEYNQILATGLEGTGGPDVAMLRSYGGLQNLIVADQLVPITDEIDGLDQIDATVLQGATGKEDGEIYGVPFATQTLQMLYNKTMFDDMGLEEPTTWKEFIRLQDDLVEAGVTPMALAAREDWVLPIFTDIIGSAHYGGSEFEAQVLSGEKDFLAPEFVGALDAVSEMRQYLDPNVMAIGSADATIQFTSGQAAQWPGGSYDLKNFEDTAPDTEFGVYQVPVSPDSVLDRPVTPAYADGSFGINAASENQEASLELLQWMTTPEYGQAIADEIGQFSALPDVTYSNPLMQEMQDLYNEGPAPYLLLVNFRYGDPSGTVVLGTNIQKMFLGESTPEQVATALQTGISAWFTPGE
ncbi:MAG: extracellular solute-binding protein [Salinibacterium sp.]|nr:extracellular solute-binding protein [Salinibacterium sp.]